MRSRTSRRARPTWRSSASPPLSPACPSSSLTRSPTCRFYDRIAKSYRRDGWRDILDSILERTFRAAVLCDEWDAAVRAGFELLAPSASPSLTLAVEPALTCLSSTRTGSKIAVAQREQYAQELLEILETRAPPPGKARVQLDTADIAPLRELPLLPRSPSPSLDDQD